MFGLSRLGVLVHTIAKSVDTIKGPTAPAKTVPQPYARPLFLLVISLTFAQDAIEFMVEKALEFKLGARGLRSICEAILTDAMFELPSQKDKNTFDLDLSYAMEKLNRSKIASQHAA